MQISFAPISLWIEHLSLISYYRNGRCNMTSIWRKFFSLRSDSHLFFRNWPVSFYFWMFLTQGFKQIVSVSCSCHPSWCCLSYFQSVKTCARWLLGPFCSWAIVGGRALLRVRAPFPLPDGVLVPLWEGRQGTGVCERTPAVITTWAHTAPFSWQWYYAYSLILALSCIPKGIMSCLLPICLGPWLD